MNRKKRLTIFASYDQDNIIDDYVVFYIQKMSVISDIIFVSDCDIIDSALQKIKDYVIHIINGRHGEYDFGSYKRGYLYAKENHILNNYDYLILCNDSCYGPFFNFYDIVRDMEEKNTDVWGIFKYLEDKNFKEHLQSYFLSFKKNVFLKDWYNDFILSIKKENDKNDIIRKYEEGLSILLREHNCSISSFLDSSIKDYKSDNNSVVTDNTVKVISSGFPFIKIAIFREIVFCKNNIDDLKIIFSLIKDTYDKKFIINHLNRVINDKSNIKYLFRRFRIFNFNLISKYFLNIYSKYSVSGRYQITFLFFNYIRITIDISKKISFIDPGYKDFNFLLDE